MGIHQLEKTHCPHGHEYSTENTYFRNDGGRACRICSRLRNKSYKFSKRIRKPINEMTLEERFWPRVDKSGECWLWTGNVNATGYGLITYKYRGYWAHRVSYEIANGPIPLGMMVRHNCDNPPCVNPAHLSIGTHKDNMNDMVVRGRHKSLKVTHCPKGHEYTPENTVAQGKNGNGRHCKECRRQSDKLRREAKKAKRIAEV